MNYEDKIKYCENFILIGLSEEEAFYHVGMTEKEMELAKNDQEFKKRIAWNLRNEHIRLKGLYKQTAEKAAKTKLDWKAALSLLETEFPDKYGKTKKNEDESGKLILSIEDEKL